MTDFEKWQSEKYIIDCKTWEARCPNCHSLVESTWQISSNYRFCPHCGFDMKSNIKEWDRKGEISKLTLDEAIKHFLTEAEQNENFAITLKRYKESDTDFYNELSAARAESDCLQCAADSRQLAEWLTELKQWRRVYGICPSYEMCIPECREGYNAQIAEYKRLLKAAFEDINAAEACDTCEYYPVINSDMCQKNDCYKWRYADEALKLIES